jgi:tripartite ATP-independent transporter DctM subunit
MSVPILISFFFLVAVGVPIAIALGAAGSIGAWTAGFPMVMIPTRFFTSLDNFALLAAPFYILAGDFMNRSGITTTLIAFSARMTRWTSGGTAYANVLSSILFAGISGTAIADTAALGQIFINGMPKEGYRKEFAAAVTVASSMIGPIIPPSVIMIVYASVARVSIIKLFIAGFIPGLLLGLACAVVIFLYGLRRGLPRDSFRFDDKSLTRVYVESVLVFTIPAFIVIGTLSGAFTATEAGGIACIYAFLIGRLVFKTLKGGESVRALKSAIRTTSSLYLVIAGASVVSYVLTVTGAVSQIGGIVGLFAGSPEIFLVFVLVCLLIVGFFLEPGVQVMLLVPIFLPIARQLGIDDMHFAMVFLLSGTLSLMTPPVGICLFVACQIGDIPVGRMFREILPFLFAEVAVILLLIFVPEVTVYLPNLIVG